jgi:iron(III) transport system ATP-binding protein
MSAAPILTAVAVEVRGLTKSFGSTPVLSGVDLTVPAGDVVAVLGASGCGKTTLLRVLAGFESADAGTVTLDGAVVDGGGRPVPPERRRVAVVPQEQALFPHLSVAANVGFGLPRSQRGSSRRPGARVEEALELVGLAGLGPRRPHELSGGQQQRVAVARALAARPAVVLLDEPFSALDAALRGALRADVRAALHAAGATGVLVTHDQAEALSVADRVAVLRDGRIVQSAAPAELYHRPVDLGVAEFVGEAVVLDGIVEGARVRTPLGALAVPAGATAGATRVMLRPEQVELRPAGDGVPAQVLDTEFYGHDGLVRLRLSDGQIVLARTRGSVPDVGISVGLVCTETVVTYPL